MIEIRIRRACADDSARLSLLARNAKASWGYPAEWLELWRTDLTLTPSYIESHFVLAAEIEDTVVGVCALDDRVEGCELEHVWVDPAEQGKGIGRALVEKALARARAVKAGKVRVLSDPFAENFYACMGARKVAEIPASMPGVPQRVLPLLEFTL